MDSSKNSWTTEVKQNPKTKELYIEFFENSFKKLGWKKGDIIVWEKLSKESWSLKKK